MVAALLTPVTRSSLRGAPPPPQDVLKPCSSQSSRSARPRRRTLTSRPRTCPASGCSPPARSSLWSPMAYKMHFGTPPRNLSAPVSHRRAPSSAARATRRGRVTSCSPMTGRRPAARPRRAALRARRAVPRALHTHHHPTTLAAGARAGRAEERRGRRPLPRHRGPALPVGRQRRLRRAPRGGDDRPERVRRAGGAGGGAERERRHRVARRGRLAAPHVDAVPHLRPHGAGAHRAVGPHQRDLRDPPALRVRRVVPRDERARPGSTGATPW